MNIEEINNELMEFQNRCRKLPKALKEWPAFHALKKTIDDFNDICPLLELMSNKAMKYRHWQKIQGITGIRILYPTRKEKKINIGAWHREKIRKFFNYTGIT